MASGVFVTGTGTEVGKTVVASVIARTFAAQGMRVSAFKPAVSGLDEIAAEGGVPDHEHLRVAAGSQQSDDEISPYRYGPAVSPHLAAQMSGVDIDAGVLRSGLDAARQAGDYLVCEGVGGFLVPLRPDYLIRDFAKDAGLPVVIVAPPSLGTINHTLLTIESVRAAGLDVACVVLNPWPIEPSDMERSNRETIERLGSSPVLSLGRIDPADPDAWPELRI